MPEDVADYTRCLASAAKVQQCSGTPAQTWQVMPDGMLRPGQGCLTQIGDRAALTKCRSTDSQRWRYTLPGNLINRASGRCLTGPASGGLLVQACEHNVASQIWSLPNGKTSPRGTS